MAPGSPFLSTVDPQSIARAPLLETFNSDRPSQTHTAKQGYETWCTAWSPDGEYFAWSCGNCQVKVITWASYYRNSQKHVADRKLLTIDAKDRVWSLAIGVCRGGAPKPNTFTWNWFRYKSAPAQILAVGLNDGRIKTFDLETGQPFVVLMDHKQVVRDLTFSPNNTQVLVSASRDGTLKVWDLQDDGNMSKTLVSRSNWLYACKWSPNGRQVASVGDNRSVIIWDMKTYKAARHLNGHQHDVCSCDFSPDGALLATASCDTSVIIWRVDQGAIMRKLQHLFPAPTPLFAGGDNDAFVRGVSWSSDGVHIATVCDDTYVRFWDLTSDDVTPCQAVSIPNPLCCGYSPDGSLLATGTQDGFVSLWLAPMRLLSLHHQLCFRTRDGCVSLWLAPMRLLSLHHQLCFRTRDGCVSLWLAPMRLLSLHHHCRMTIRSALGLNQTNQLVLPPSLQRYLQYNVI